MVSVVGIRFSCDNVAARLPGAHTPAAVGSFPSIAPQGGAVKQAGRPPGGLSAAFGPLEP